MRIDLLIAAMTSLVFRAESRAWKHRQKILGMIEVIPSWSIWKVQDSPAFSSSLNILHTMQAILGDESHIYHYEAGGISVLGGIAFNLLPNLPNGEIPLDKIKAAVRYGVPSLVLAFSQLPSKRYWEDVSALQGMPQAEASYLYATLHQNCNVSLRLTKCTASRPEDEHFARTACICLESTQNRCGGKVLSLEYMRSVKEFADSKVTCFTSPLSSLCTHKSPGKVYPFPCKKGPHDLIDQFVRNSEIFNPNVLIVLRHLNPYWLWILISYALSEQIIFGMDGTSQFCQQSCLADIFHQVIPAVILPSTLQSIV